MTILVLGATGNTGRPLLAHLAERGLPARPANRHPVPGGVWFDWFDPSGFRRALAGVRAVYLVPPLLTLEPMAIAEPFLAEAHAAGVRRVVLLGSLAELPGGDGIGALRRAVREFDEWAELRPSGFMQNLLPGHPMGAEIAERGEVRSATGSGRLGWIAAEDIAAVAAEALAREAPVNDEVVLTGPEALAYDEAAAIISEVAERTVRHVPLSVADIRQRNIDAGVPEAFATALAEMDRNIAYGSEDRVTDEVRRLTGSEPRSLRAFVRAHAEEWTRR